MWVNINGVTDIPVLTQISAESLTNVTGYRIENNAIAEGGSMLSLINGPSNTEVGTATFTFNGPSGLYHLIIGTFDENDGQSKFNLTQQGNLVGSILLNQDFNSNVPSSTTKVERLLGSELTVTTGNSFTITGFENNGEAARLDFIRFVPVSLASITTTGSSGADNLIGGSGSDTLSSGNGSDNIFGGSGNDTIFGGTDNDTIFGGNDNDTIDGGAGNDSLDGGTGNDILLGNNGNDTLIGGGGNDSLTGGGGIDTFRYLSLSDSLLNGFDRITAFQIGTDILDGPNAVSAANIAKLGAVASLTQTGIQSVLTNGSFTANRAATFSFGTRTFLALNDSTAGFLQNNDAIIEITGFSGSLNSLAIA